MPRRGRGGACCGGQGADDKDGVDGAALDGERVEQRADGAAASRTSTPGSQAQVSQAQRPRAAWAMRESAGVTAAGSSCDRGVDVAPTGRGGDVERVRWPSSPTARSCGCLRRGRNSQAVRKTGAAARSHVPMASASCIAPRRARSLRSRAGAGADIARARGLVHVHVQHAQRPRAQRQGRPKLRHM